MGADSKIEWTDYTFNPWRGCAKISPGCANCYAERLSRINPAVLGEWGRGKRRVLGSAEYWRLPIQWDKAALESDWRPRIFCASIADWLDDEVPVAWLGDLLELIDATPNLDWLLLSKRIDLWWERIEKVADCNMAREWLEGRAPANVWLGTSVEDQRRANLRVPRLLAIPAKVRFVSCEPLLEEVDVECEAQERVVRDLAVGFMSNVAVASRVDWVICGGESGPNARPMEAAWARSLRDRCASSGTPFFFKQWGEWVPSGKDGGMVRIGKRRTGRMLDGCEYSEFPSSGV